MRRMDVEELMNGPSPEATIAAFLRILVAVKQRREQLVNDSEAWKQMIVDTALESPLFWTAALDLLVSLGTFWNISFGATATEVALAKRKSIEKAYLMNACHAPTPILGKKYWLDDVIAVVPSDTKELSDAFQGLDPKDQGEAIWKDDDYSALPPHLKAFRIIMGNLETFERLFFFNCGKFLSSIESSASRDTILDFLDPDTTGALESFRTKVRAEVEFLEDIQFQLASASSIMSTPRSQPFAAAGSDMSALRDYVQWSTDIPPNTPTLVAMQRLLMSI